MSTGIPDELLEDLERCDHEACLSLAQLLVGAWWSDGTFQAYTTCIAHTGWAVQELLPSIGEGGAISIAVVQLHAGGTTSRN